MAGANSQIQISELDFNNIKENLKTFLKSQDVIKDYNFEGSAMSVLLDVLAYNTQYNSYYLNMVANEMFLDTALMRGSIVSQAKLLNYTPRSAISSQAIVDITVSNVSTPTLTLTKNHQFLSENIDGISYVFVAETETTVDVVGNQAVFSDIILREGSPLNITYTVDITSNPNFVFKIPEQNVDTTSLEVTVQQSISNSQFSVYTQASDVLTLDGDSKVYFLQENIDGYYEVSFGDGVLGKPLVDGNLVILSYRSTNGLAAQDANSFVTMSAIEGFSNIVINPLQAASGGADRESIESIKFQAPKSFAAQKRAVTKQDYITAIQQNSLGFSFDAVSVWGGEENDTPVYGQVFISLKPSGAYNLTTIQKQKLIEEVIKPISVMTVQPTIVDPDYTYLQLTTNVYYDPKKTNLTPGQLKTTIKNTISSLAANSLNTFNSTFNVTDFNNAINNCNQSIITNELNVQVQKKLFPILTTSTTYRLYCGVPLKKGMFLSGIGSSPSMKFRDPVTPSLIIDGVYLEEVPSSTGGVESVSVINPGFSYQESPAVEILGDGTGATAEAIITSNGTIKEINIIDKGTGYTSAIVKITAASNDTTGQLGSAVANLEGRYGTIRSYYNNNENVKNIFDANVGTIDYNLGVITLNSFNPYDINNELGQLTITANPTTTIISSTYNRIITVDPFDPNSIIVNLIPKTT